MPMTLEELKVIERVLDKFDTHKMTWDLWQDCSHSLGIVRREIKLKETDFVTGEKIKK